MIKIFKENYQKVYRGPMKKEVAKKMLQGLLNSEGFAYGIKTKVVRGFLRKRQKTNKYDVYTKVIHEEAICNKCNKKAEDEIDFEFIKQNGICLACDHVEGEIIESYKLNE